MDEHESIIDNGSGGNQFVAVVETCGDLHFDILNHLFLNSGLQMTYFKLRL